MMILIIPRVQLASRNEPRHIIYIKGADQPVHPRSLINAFAIPCLDCIMPLVSTAITKYVEDK